MLLTTHQLLLTTHYSLLPAHPLLLTTHRSLLTTHRLLLNTYYALLATYCAPLTTHYAPLTTYYAPPTTDYALLTTYYAPPTTDYDHLHIGVPYYGLKSNIDALHLCGLVFIFLNAAGGVMDELKRVKHQVGSSNQRTASSMYSLVSTTGQATCANVASGKR